MKNLKQMELIKSKSSRVAILANPSQSLESKELKKIRDTSGQKCLDLSKNVGQLGLLEKMLVDTLNSVSTQYYRTWRVKDTPQGHLVFQLVASVPTTKENASGLWPTPTAMTGGQGIAPSHKKGKHGWNTGAAVQDSLSKNPIRMWPTPRAAIGMNMKLTENMAKLRHKKYLETEVAYQEKAPGGHLNPKWVEWLMGYPIGWTD